MQPGIPECISHQPANPHNFKNNTNTVLGNIVVRVLQVRISNLGFNNK